MVPGPAALGRGVVVPAGAEPPTPWAGAPRLLLDADALVRPRPVADVLHGHWLERRPVVVELAVPNDDLRVPESTDVEPWALDAGFELSRERLAFLVWSNNYDCRQGTPVWWWARRAERLGARRGDAGDGAEVVLPDGTAAWCDGGPHEPFGPPQLGGAALVHRDTIEAGSLAPVGRGTVPPDGAATLAPDQLAAVTHRRGPARVIAPAGSGKTRVLTERLRHLLAHRGADPRTVTAVAFNKKAEEQLRERTAGLSPTIRTLNALGLRISSRFGANRQVIDEREVRRLLEGLVPVRPKANTDVYAPYIDGLSAIRIGLVDPAEAEARYPDAAGLADLFPRWRALLAGKGLIDFDDQIYTALEILLRDPEARRRLQARCRHLLVDEFQDLTPAHMLLLRLLAAPGYTVFGVGDDDQTIYGHVGADPGFLIDYERYFPGAAGYELEVNYRCAPAIVEATGRLLAHNRRRVPKRTRPASPPAPGGGEDALVVERGPAAEHAPAVVERVRKWQADGIALAEIAVLSRVNATLLAPQVSLVAAGIPCTTPVDTAILSRTGIRTALAYLRIGLDPGRIAARDVADTIRRPSRRVARNVVAMLTDRGGTSITDIRRLAGRLTGADAGRLEDYAADLDAVVTAVTGGTEEVFRVVRDVVGLGGSMEALDRSRADAGAPHADDLGALIQASAVHPEPATFEAWLRDMLRPRRQGDDRVQLSTVHRVKGREWDRVLVVGADAGLFPHRLADDTEEERRVFHVAITRARGQVVVLADREAPSPFLDEMAGTAPPPPPGPPPGPPSGPRPERPPNRPRPRPGARAGAEPDAAVVAALKEWRRATAAAAGVPAYVVLHDRQLEGIARRMPTTTAQLATCEGIGRQRLERYGAELLEVIARFAAT